MATYSDGFPNTVTASGQHAAAVSPSDTVDLTVPTRALYIGGAGDVVVNMLGGDSTIKFAATIAGSILPIRVTRVLNTNTTATNIVAIW